MLVLLVFAVATAVAVASGGLVRRLAPRIGAVVPPRPDRWHRAPTPTMGGIAIVGATLVGCVPAAFFPDVLPWFDTWMPVPLAALAMFARWRARRSSAALSDGETRGVARGGRPPRLHPRAQRAWRAPGLHHPHRHRLVRRRVSRHEPARQHGRAGDRSGAYCGRVPGRDLRRHSRRRA